MTICRAPPQSAREKASAAFRTAPEAMLFSSDVSARGVDYPDVTLVLQVRGNSRADETTQNNYLSPQAEMFAGKASVTAWCVFVNWFHLQFINLQ